jgi:prepilin-type N-terminal cleavage/methylation domain-containing protein
MTAPRARARRAFTLVEILVAVVILGIVGAGLVRLILSQTRFTEKQMASRNARTVSRNAMNIMVTDLRMVQDRGGLIAATRDSVTTRVPVAFGLLCAYNGAANTLSLLPVDPAITSMGFYNGWAARDSTGEFYNYVEAANNTTFDALPVGLALTCTGGPAISQITYNGRVGKIVQVGGSFAPAPAPNPGWPVFVYHVVTYKFAPSTAFPGRVGLWRTVRNGGTVATPTVLSDEIIAPFDTAAKFRFYVLNEDTAQSAVPADLNTVRGLQLHLAGSSPGTPRDSDAPAKAALVTGVFFKNRRDP